ncbi:unnamed protein product [Timema podura]|uniref:Uncharacterized protein n=1 Tax=Timema podura TaxID=61482 RepID=A0ABN7NGP7_TIMPD|nr:unnamed protein product [Timema podura]
MDCDSDDGEVNFNTEVHQSDTEEMDKDQEHGMEDSDQQSSSDDDGGRTARLRTKTNLRMQSLTNVETLILWGFDCPCRAVPTEKKEELYVRAHCALSAALGQLVELFFRVRLGTWSMLQYALDTWLPPSNPSLPAVVPAPLEHLLFESIEENQLHLLNKHRLICLRQKIEETWAKTYASDAEKMNFTDFTLDNYTEASLSKHQTYLDALQNYYSTNETLFKELELLIQLQNKFEASQLLLLDSTRLFRNRGGALLKEEKDRQLTKKVEKVW